MNIADNIAPPPEGASRLEMLEYAAFLLSVVMDEHGHLIFPHLASECDRVIMDLMLDHKEQNKPGHAFGSGYGLDLVDL